MSGIVINGFRVEVPGRSSTCYLDDPRLRLLATDGKHRTAAPQLIVLHTTKGIPGGRDRRPQVLRAGRGPDVGAELRCARWWSSSELASGAHLVVDHDGSIGCLADVATVTAYHARAMNGRSVGIEVYQGADAELYAEQLEAVADLVDVLTVKLGIQRQIPDRYRGPVDRLHRGGADVVGVVGHRDGDPNRGAGDPGDLVFEVLARRGYERRNLAAGEDLEVWRQRQRDLGAGLRIDGVPGPATVRALADAGYRHGLFAAGRA